MGRFITNVEVEEFLKDYTKNSETMLLEEGKEKNELEKIAKANGMDIKNSRDLGIFKTIYTFSNKPNDNGAILPKKELLRVLPQIIGKPININHDRSAVVGHYIDYTYLQKQDTVVAYGVYYKSYYEDLWEKAKELFKSKELSSSFEIWSPKDKRKIKSDGTYELKSMEIAGGALIYEDEENQPAFKNAKVLSMAKEKAKNDLELVYASKHKEEELIFQGKQEKAEIFTTPTALKITCSNCEEEFETAEVANIKCPKCHSILNKEGVMQYPPQVKDFKIMCPGCKINNWLILSKTDDESKLRCMSCTKEYKISFKKSTGKVLPKNMSFIYSGSVTCYQCHTIIPIDSISSLNKRETKCHKCGLHFSFDTHNEKFKNISNIEEVVKDSINKSSGKGGELMDKTKTVVKASEKKPVVKEVKPVVKEVKPVVKEVKPVVKEVKPVVKEVKPVVKEKTPKTEIKVDVEKVKEEITKLEVEVEKAHNKELKISSLLEKYKKLVKKAVNKIRTVRKESKTTIDSASNKEILLKAGVRKAVKQYTDFKKQAEEKIEFYKANAIIVVERREVIGDSLTDEEIINDDKFERVKLEMENARIKTGDKVSDEIICSKKKTNDYFTKKRKEIDDIAFGRNKKKKQR